MFIKTYLNQKFNYFIPVFSFQIFILCGKSCLYIIPDLSYKLNLKWYKGLLLLKIMFPQLSFTILLIFLHKKICMFSRYGFTYWTYRPLDTFCKFTQTLIFVLYVRSAILISNFISVLVWFYNVLNIVPCNHGVTI